MSEVSDGAHSNSRAISAIGRNKRYGWSGNGRKPSRSQKLRASSFLASTMMANEAISLLAARSKASASRIRPVNSSVSPAGTQRHATNETGQMCHLCQLYRVFPKGLNCTLGMRHWNSGLPPHVSGLSALPRGRAGNLSSRGRTTIVIPAKAGIQTRLQNSWQGWAPSGSSPCPPDMAGQCGALPCCLISPG